ncbi:MAG: ribosome small subunit-dependent GTPase A [Deltaproteobacteria bacterium]|nr:ribosome small subunit-dependent GTPase A [Deltaproteobacteria bacterium]
MAKHRRPTTMQRAPQGRPGTVVEHLGVAVEVETEGGERRRVRVARNSGLVVGDVVLVDGERVEASARRTELRRRTAGGAVHVVAANLDALCVVAAVDPPAKAGLVDRAVVAARAAGIRPVVVVNKSDLPDPEGVIPSMRARGEDSLVVLVVSAHSGEGVDRLAALIAEVGRAVLVGPSGVGKSSLLNRLLPEAARSTSELSAARGAGVHTTTTSTLWRLPAGGELVDTPGVREYGLVDVPPEDLAAYFPAFAAVPEPCRFRDCRHEDEPGCAVRAALADGRLPEHRYLAYRTLLDEAKLLERKASSRS